jgi:hypothetical protein
MRGNTSAADLAKLGFVQRAGHRVLGFLDRIDG